MRKTLGSVHWSRHTIEGHQITRYYFCLGGNLSHKLLIELMYNVKRGKQKKRNIYFCPDMFCFPVPFFGTRNTFPQDSFDKIIGLEAVIFFTPRLVVTS